MGKIEIELFGIVDVIEWYEITLVFHNRNRNSFTIYRNEFCGRVVAAKNGIFVQHDSK